MFLQVADTIKFNGVDEHAIRLRLFPFSLKGKALAWFHALQPGCISTWEELVDKFLTKFFPPSKSSKLRSEIGQFRQLDFEPMNEAWERFKELLRKSPQHGYDEWVLIDMFYNGLNGHTKTIVDSTACGSLMAKTVDEAYALLEEMASSSFSGLLRGKWEGDLPVYMKLMCSPI